MPTAVTSLASRRPPAPDGPIDASPRRRGRPARLSRPAILAEAIRLIDDEGADALTMRRLGAVLGVEAMSLYRHVESKQTLLDGIAEQLMSEVGSCRADHGLGWAESARALAIGVRAVARAHPAAFGLVGLRALNTEESLRPIEALLADLRAGGFSPARAVAIHRLLASYIRGFVLVEIAGFSLSPSGSDPFRLTGDQLPPETFPTIRELARELAKEPTEDQYLAGLETIIGGLSAELGVARARNGSRPASLSARARARARP